MSNDPKNTPSLYRTILDRLVRWRMEANGHEIEEDWLDDNDMLDRSKLPPHLTGLFDQIVENALRRWTPRRPR